MDSVDFIKEFFASRLSIPGTRTRTEDFSGRFLRLEHYRIMATQNHESEDSERTSREKTQKTQNGKSTTESNGCMAVNTKLAKVAKHVESRAPFAFFAIFCSKPSPS